MCLELYPTTGSFSSQHNLLNNGLLLLNYLTAGEIEDYELYNLIKVHRQSVSRCEYRQITKATNILLWRSLKEKVKVAQLFPTLAPWTVAHQAPLSMEFSRQEYWSGLPFPFPGDLPDPEIEPGSPTLQTGSLLFEPAGKPTTEDLYVRI